LRNDFNLGGHSLRLRHHGQMGQAKCLSNHREDYKGFSLD